MIVAGVEVWFTTHHHRNRPAAQARFDYTDFGPHAGHAAALAAAAIVFFDTEFLRVLAARQMARDHRTQLLTAQNPVDLFVVFGRAAATLFENGGEQGGEVVGARHREAAGIWV